MLCTSDMTNREDDPASYLAAVDELMRGTKPGGRVYISIPYGRRHNGGWLQEFDAAMIRAMIAWCPSCITEETSFLYRDDQWRIADAVSCRDAEHYDVHSGELRPADNLAASRAAACLAIHKPLAVTTPEGGHPPGGERDG